MQYFTLYSNLLLIINDKGPVIYENFGLII